MEINVRDGKLRDISEVARASNVIGKQNYKILKESLPQFDALVQDEFIETMFSFMWDKIPKLPRKKVIVTDYFRFESSSQNPFRRIVTWYANRMLAKAFCNSGLIIFADHADYLLTNLKRFEIVGPIIEEPPSETRMQLRDKFSIGEHQLVVVVSGGGTSTGKYIVDFIVSNLKSIQSSLGEVLFVILLGTRMERPEIAGDSKGIVFIPFTSNSLAYFKLADCVVTQSGGSTLNELASLGTPCVTIPIRNHWEQEANARKFREKYDFEIIRSDELGVQPLANSIKRVINSEYEPLISDGGSRAAKLISDYLLAE